MAWYDGNDTTLVSGAPSASDAFADSKATGGDAFGSPAFNTGGDGKHNVEDVEVKMAHRFRLKFGVFRAVGHHVKTVDKPNVTFAEVEVAKLNTKVYFAGRKTQDAANLEMDDSLDGAVSRATQTQLQKQANFDNNYHAKSAAAYFFNMTAEELTGDGAALMAWYYHKCVVMSCNYGTLDYSDDAGLSSITLSVRYANFTTWMPSFDWGTAVDDSTDSSNATTSSAFATA